MNIADDPNRINQFFRQYQIAENVLTYLNPIEAIGVHAIGPLNDPISKEVEKHEYVTPVYI